MELSEYNKNNVKSKQYKNLNIDISENYENDEKKDSIKCNS
jgi:hypothetical protein